MIPCHKKESTRERGNFQPISILSMLSKPLERHVSLSFSEHLRSHDLMYPNQSGFRTNHSCETTLINMTDKWLKAMDDGELVGAAFMDLSKAIDLVNHDVLRKKLAKYLISPQALQWFTTYLDNRTQQCLTLGALSSPLTLERGVPQGSILGPVLFSVYINDLPLSLGEANTDMYVDDTTLWSSSKSCNEIQQTLQSALNIIEQWLAVNHMVPNKLLIGTVQKLRHSGTDELGLYFDEIKLSEIKDEKLDEKN